MIEKSLEVTVGEKKRRILDNSTSLDADDYVVVACNDAARLSYAYIEGRKLVGRHTLAAGSTLHFGWLISSKGPIFQLRHQRMWSPRDAPPRTHARADLLERVHVTV